MEAEEQRAEQSAAAFKDAEDETPEEFAEELEADPAYNPQDEELKREKGG